MLKEELFLIVKSNLKKIDDLLIKDVLNDAVNCLEKSNLDVKTVTFVLSNPVVRITALCLLDKCNKDCLNASWIMNIDEKTILKDINLNGKSLTDKIKIIEDKLLTLKDVGQYLAYTQQMSYKLFNLNDDNDEYL